MGTRAKSVIAAKRTYHRCRFNMVVTQHLLCMMIEATLDLLHSAKLVAHNALTYVATWQRCKGVSALQAALAPLCTRTAPRDNVVKGLTLCMQKQLLH